MLFIQQDWNLEGESIEGVSLRTRFESFCKKGELVARVFTAAEKNLPVCMDAYAHVLQTLHEKESVLITPEGILPNH